MTHWSADVSDEVIRLLTEARVHVIAFAPHTTRVFQVLDLTFVGDLKRCPRYELPFDENNATDKVITKVYHDFTQTMARPNVWGTFWALGLEFDTSGEPHELLFDEVKLRESAGFEELCPVTFPWTNDGADDVLLALVGSIILNKSTRRQCLCVSLIMDEDIFGCQKMQKVAVRRSSGKEKHDVSKLSFNCQMSKMR
jgi:hypothetical protein